MIQRRCDPPLSRQPERWSNEHPVARMMRQGDRWLMAWIFQKATPFQRLEKLTRISRARLMDLQQGAAVTRVELEALAKAWDIEVGDLIRSMAGTVEIAG